LFSLAGVKLCLSLAFHPQTEGQSEVTNKIIMMYLRCLIDDRSRQWVQWLPWAEFCYNSTYQASLKTSPFRVVYGRDPPSVRAYTVGETRLPAVQQQLQDRDEFLAEVRERLEQAQQHYKDFYDRKHRELEFQAGDWVWLRLIHRLAASMDIKGRNNLGPHFFEPFQVLARVGEVAYKLKLPEGACLHNVFHVGVLKRYRGSPPDAPGSLPTVHHGRACLTPASVLHSRLARDILELLVHWSGQPAAEASWVPLEEFSELYPSFQLEDELLLKGGSDVMYGRQYTGAKSRPMAQREIGEVDPHQRTTAPEDQPSAN
jgi:hypothetical protein